LNEKQLRNAFDEYIGTRQLKTNYDKERLNQWKERGFVKRRRYQIVPQVLTVILFFGIIGGLFTWFSSMNSQSAPSNSIVDYQVGNLPLYEIYELNPKYEQLYIDLIEYFISLDEANFLSHPAKKYAEETIKYLYSMESGNKNIASSYLVSPEEHLNQAMEFYQSVSTYEVTVTDIKRISDNKIAIGLKFVNGDETIHRIIHLIENSSLQFIDTRDLGISY